MTPRPNSIAEVARRAIDAQSFACELADFLHEFARCGEAAMLAASPPLLIFDTILAEMIRFQQVAMLKLA